MAAMQGKKNHTTSTVIKGQTIRKLMGGGGEGKVQKKYLRKGKLNKKKIHARQLTLKNNHAMA